MCLSLRPRRNWSIRLYTRLGLVFIPPFLITRGEAVGISWTWRHDKTFSRVNYTIMVLFHFPLVSSCALYRSSNAVDKPEHCWCFHFALFIYLYIANSKVHEANCQGSVNHRGTSGFRRSQEDYISQVTHGPEEEQSPITSLVWTACLFKWVNGSWIWSANSTFV